MLAGVKRWQWELWWWQRKCWVWWGGDPVSTGDKAVVACHPWHEQALVEVLAVLMGVTGTEG